VASTLKDTPLTNLISQNDCPDAKKNIIEDFLKRLATLSEIENCLTALSLLPDCLEVDVLSNVRMILRLDELTKALESVFFEVFRILIGKGRRRDTPE